jgi:PAS domain S-box-containing protein
MTENTTPSENDSDVDPRTAHDRRRASEASAWLAAIVENSDDAILSKTLDGIITTWNRGAERLFGYTAAEAIGKPITLVIPEDRHHEEDGILRRLRAGERIDHFETVRRRKDGELIEVSLTVSPVRNEAGEILGASKIARDITAQKRAAAQQSIMLREMHHRIKNLFTMATALISLSAKASTSTSDLATDLSARMQALARAHSLTLPDLNNDPGTETETTFTALLRAILAPHEHDVGSRISISGADAPIGGNALTSAALLLHELATNAAKYGALSTTEGRLEIRLDVSGDRLHMTWDERGIALAGEANHEGFGSTLERASLQGLRGELSRNWHADGLSLSLIMPLQQLLRQA